MEADLSLSVELRVLHGPQAGSRLPLGAGEYLMGSEDECAIILSGPRIAGQHAHLTFDGETLWLRPLEGEVCDAQGNELTGETVLALGLPLELGGIWVAVDSVDAAWPAAEAVAPMPRTAIPAQPGDDMEEGPSAGEEADDAPPDASEAYPFDEAAENERGAQAQHDAAAAAAASTAGWRGIFSRPRARVLVLSLVSLAAVAVLGACAVAWIAREPEKTESVPPPQPIIQAPRQPSPQLAELVAKRGGRLTLRLESGEWVVEGYVPNGAARSALAEELSGMDPRPQMKVVDEEEMLAAANKFLAARNNGVSQLLRAESTGGGGIKLTGAATTAETVNAAGESLRAAVPAISRLEASVLQPAALRERLRQQLVVAGLKDRIAVVAETPELTLSGNLTAEETVRWENMLVEFTRQYGSVLPIRASIGRVRPPLPVNVQVIVGGRTPYIVTESGERVNTGGDLNGHTLVTVKDAEVIFEGSKQIRVAR
ncbi:MAG: hypothetical protein JWP36_2300 [Paucimonas sp.]|nr:hypothetical protein [Paucimonas sp.]